MTEPDQKGEDVKQNVVTTTKDEEEVAEMKKLEKEEEDTPQEPRKSERTQKHLSNMVTTNMQTPQPTACTMLCIIYVRYMNSQPYKKQNQVIMLQSGKSLRF